MGSNSIFISYDLIETYFSKMCSDFWDTMYMLKLSLITFKNTLYFKKLIVKTMKLEVFPSEEINNEK